MDIIDNLLNNKKTYIAMLVAYIIIVFITLIFIWGPEKNLEISKYTSYNETAVNEQMIRYYFDIISKVSIYNSKSSLEKILSPRYLEYSNQSVEDVLKKFEAGLTYPSYSNIVTYNMGDNRIYTGKMQVNNKLVSINIIEESPYSMYITLDGFIDYYSLNRSILKDGLKIKLNNVYKDLNYVEYEISVENVNATICNMDFTIPSNTYLELYDGKQVYLSNTYNNDQFEQLNTNEIAVRNLIFNISVEEQINIKSLNFNNVKIDGKLYTVNIEL